MNALAAPASYLAPNARAQAPYRRDANALDANGLAGLGGMLGQLGGKLVRGDLGEAHSLSVDMHVEATRGVIQTEHGEVHFERIELSFSIQETHVEMRESKPGGGKELLDGLKGLASLLDDATKESPAAGFDLDQLRALLADQAEQLDQLLEQIGRGFERLAKRQRGDEESAVEAYAEQTVVQLESLRFVRSAPAETAPSLAEAVQPAE
jgi:hypothetical protein